MYWTAETFFKPKCLGFYYSLYLAKLVHALLHREKLPREKKMPSFWPILIEGDLPALVHVNGEGGGVKVRAGG